jgi:anti-sigma B factor antagonist
MEEFMQLAQDLDAPLSVEIRPERPRAVVVPHGDLDLSSVDALGAELDDLVGRGFEEIVLDLRALSFMDSTGLHLVLAQSARRDARVTLIDGTGPVSRLFDIAGVRSALPFEVSPFE